MKNQNTPDYAQPSSVWALDRWVRGHQVFFVLIQLITVALNEVLRHAKTGRYDLVRKSLDVTTELLYGSASAFRLTGDFTPDDYGNIVRPSMEPPATPPGFSGLWSADHAEMVRTINKVKDLLPTMPASLQEAHDRFLDAFSEMYDDHRFVCERFVGDAASLLSEASNSEISGPERLSALQQDRLHNAGRSTPRQPQASSQCPFHKNK